MIIIKTKQETLLKPLQMVTGIVENRTTLPILSNVLIKNIDNEITFLTTDLEIQIKSTIIETTLSDAEKFTLTVSAKKLQDILRSFPADAEVALVKNENKLQIKSKKSIFNLQSLPAEDFPIIPENQEVEGSITLKQRDLKNILQQVQFAIAQQDIRYYLNGLLFSIEENTLKCVATDGHRLAFSAIQIESSVAKRENILPRKTVLELIKQLRDNEDPVNIDFLSDKLRFSFSNFILTSKVIDGKFPDYNRALPTQNNKQFVLNRQIFQQALQRASILLHEKFRDVRLIIVDNNLSIICKNNEQEEAKEDIEIDYTQEEINISFNVNYLLDLLNNINEETIHCAFSEKNDATSSVLITIPNNEDFKYVVKPMRN